MKKIIAKTVLKVRKAKNSARITFQHLSLKKFIGKKVTLTLSK